MAGKSPLLAHSRTVISETLKIRDTSLTLKTNLFIYVSIGLYIDIISFHCYCQATMIKDTPKTCASCGRDFLSQHGPAKYCSQACMGRGHSKNYKKTYSFTCGQCGKQSLLGSRKKPKIRRFCDDKCRLRARRTGGDRQCLFCKKKFYCQKCESDRKYCSMSCRAKGMPVKYWAGKHRPEMMGERHFAWKGGVTSEQDRIRTSLEYKMWRVKVFERDDFTCQNCGIRGKAIHADHIKPFSLYPELRIKVSNGRVLCKNCHDLITSRYRKWLWKNQFVSRPPETLRYNFEKEFLYV
mgnify:CR=1 FL=1